MSATEPGLLRTILERPHDDAARLIYADWLDDQGEAERSEFIRVQCELEKWNPPEIAELPWLKELRRRESELWLSGRAYWTADFPGPLGDACNELGWWRRGFVAKVRCTLADWYGTKCPHCDGIGKRHHHFSSGGYAFCTCDYCFGRKRLDAHGPTIVAAQPVTRVAMTDMPIFQSGGNSTYYVGGLGRLPQEYWRSLEGLPSRPAAIDALSVALVRLARQAAGLPALAS